MSHASLPPSRHWSTWNAARPAEFTHVPSAISITPVLYAASIRKCTDFPPGKDVVFGAHAIDSSFVNLTLEHAGTKLAWSYVKPAPETLAGSWTTESLGEWGLRVWVTLCFSSAAGDPWLYDPEEKILHLDWSEGCFAIACLEPPLLLTSHANLLALKREFEERGYWYLASRAHRGAFLALRFNLEHTPSNRFALAYARDLAGARDKARAALAFRPPSISSHGPLAAARDIIAWNTVWDPINNRPYTSCSRNWDLEKFGGFGLWLTDTAVSALVSSLFDEDQAGENIDALIAGQTTEGNFPALLTGNDAWLDRSHPPIVSLIIWLIYCITGSRSLIERAYDPLVRNHRWWWRFRDGNRNQILEYGSSAKGNGLYIGTKLAAKNESFMDNSPIHDEASWVEQSRTLDCEDVGLNSLIALDAEMLGLIARALGRDEEAAAHQKVADAQRKRVSAHFWDRRRGIFANRLWNGKFVRSLSPTSFFPLLIGAAAPAQVTSLQRHLSSSKSFGGKWGLPSTARSDPAFSDNVYWRGRIWPILNWLVWLGLKRNGLMTAADTLRKKSRDLFAASWASRLAPENFNALTGAALDQPDTDPFYSWTALLPLMGLAELSDIDPWNGWCLGNVGSDMEVGPVNSPSGPVTVKRRRGWIEVHQDGELCFATDAKPGIAQLAITGRLSFMLPPDLRQPPSLRTGRTISSATQNGKTLPLGPHRTELRLRPTKTGRERVEIFLGKNQKDRRATRA
jgi:putative isomerase